MNERALQVYLLEIRFQCRRARKEYADFNNQVGLKHVEGAFGSIQNFLMCAGCISNLLFPAGKKSKRYETKDEYEKRDLRGQILRKVLELDKSEYYWNPLRARDGRDDQSHFDERLDAWMASQSESVCHNVFFLDDTKGKLRKVYTRCYVIKDEELIVLGEVCKPKLILENIETLLKKVEELTNPTNLYQKCY